MEKKWPLDYFIYKNIYTFCVDCLFGTTVRHEKATQNMGGFSTSSSCFLPCFYGYFFA
jgi:hypothetical protein